MNYLIRYHMRLGDIIRSLPIAKKLYDEGHSVAFECNKEYHGLFDMVNFCAPCTPNNLLVPHKVLDLQIWPSRYDDYRKSGKTWGDYVYGLYPESSGITEQDAFGILSDVPEIEWPEDHALVCAWGYSQPKQPDPVWLMNEVEKRTGCTKMVFLPHPVIKPTFTARNIAELAGVIKAAKYFVTIDSAPNALAAAVGKDSWFYLPSPRETDNYRIRNQVSISW